MGAVQGRANDAEEDGRTSEKLQKQNFSIEDAQKVDSNSDKQDDDSKGGDGGDSKGGDGDGDGGSGDGEGGDGESGDASEIMFMEQTTEKTYLRSQSAPIASGHHITASFAHTEHSISVRTTETGTEEGSVVTLSRGYSFTVRDKILTGPPVSFQRGRRRSSGFLEYIGRKLGGSFLYEPEDMMERDTMTDGGDIPTGGERIVGVEGREGMEGGEGGEIVQAKESSGRCRLSSLAQNTLLRIFDGIVPEEVVDYHVHLVGHGDSGSGCYMHNSTKTWRYPLRRIKTAVFMAAAQSPDMEGGDLQYISRLVRLARHFVPAAIFDKTRSGYRSGTLCLLPFDKFYEKNGTENMNNTTMYIPNDYAVQMSVDFPNLFVPFGSVNPYRHDAIQELERCSKLGVTTIKWLPNSMGIDPSDERCIPFYHKMRELGMALLIHVGHEHAVNAAYINNKLGNPLLLRRPLDCGVKVIGAHCATEGTSADLDNGGVFVPCFNLFLRLMREDKYKDLLFGDISATCAFRRLPYLKQLLQATDIHDRLVYGSDYPVPAINLVVHTSRLLRQGFITQDESTVLNELYNYNPLLFDFACKRLVTGPGGERFPSRVFRAHSLLPPFRHDSNLLGTPV